jgi:stearoyl-CoA desaturase (delta-9 desaturase)
MLGLAQVRKVAPTLRVAPIAKPAPDFATLQAVIANRYAVATAYARTLKETCAAELVRLRERAGRSEFADVPSMRGLKRWLTGDRASALRGANAQHGLAMEKSAPFRRSMRCART